MTAKIVIEITETDEGVATHISSKMLEGSPLEILMGSMLLKIVDFISSPPSNDEDE